MYICISKLLQSSAVEAHRVNILLEVFLAMQKTIVMEAFTFVLAYDVSTFLLLIFLIEEAFKACI